MEKAAHDLSEKIAFYMQYDEEKKAVIEYGLIAILNIMVIGLIISFISIFYHMWFESILIFLGVGVLKKSTGGAHAETMLGCIIISVFSITLLAAASRYMLSFKLNIYMNIGMTILITALSCIIFYRLVPVATANKPIKKLEKIKRLRQQSFILVGFYTVISILMIILAPTYYRLNSLAFSMHFVLIWQTFMVTRFGQRFISLFDLKFKVKEVKK